jgi:DNA recombination protein RmuC
MVEHCDFGQQQTLSGEGGRLRPDMVVRLPGGRHVVVDAKVPLEAYLDALETDDDDERRDRMAAHAAQVRAHVLKLGGKGYWAGLDDSPEFVVMFLPSESMYSAALEEAPSLIEEGVARRVLIATPTTLIALLQTIHFGWRQERLAENARAISEQGRVLHERLCTLFEHWSKLGGALGRATEHFNAAVASFDSRVMPAVRKLEELGTGGSKPVGELATVDGRPRPVIAPAASSADC